MILLSISLTLKVPEEWLFQKRVMHTKFDIYVFLFQYIKLFLDIPEF